ncbi:MAG: hypothetical protein KGK30_04990, partial [Elusimicrobia bacterium]|nr:hypothetical protein [Elusimicrobiota bacterium]
NGCVWYLNGSSVSTSASAWTGSDNGQNLSISSLVDPLTGTLDDVRIYNRALSAAEVQELYNMGR